MSGHENVFGVPGSHAAHRARSASGGEQRKWRAGAEGERASGRIINRWARRRGPSVVVFHDLELPAGGNADHVVVDPAGVLVVESKLWSSPSRRSLALPTIAQVRRLQAFLEAEARAAGCDAPVEALVVLHPFLEHLGARGTFPVPAVSGWGLLRRLHARHDQPPWPPEPTLVRRLGALVRTSG